MAQQLQPNPVTAAREALRLRKAEFCRQRGLPHDTLIRVERGYSAGLSPAVLKALDGLPEREGAEAAYRLWLASLREPAAAGGAYMTRDDPPERAAEQGAAQPSRSPGVLRRERADTERE